jgi:hypothetical protein
MQDKGFSQRSVHRLKSNRKVARKLLKRRKLLKAAIGIEPMIKVLQTSALPLGYAATKKG